MYIQYIYGSFKWNKAKWGVRLKRMFQTFVYSQHLSKLKCILGSLFEASEKSRVPCTVWPSTGDSEQLRLVLPRTPRWPEKLAGGGGAGSAVRQSGQLSGQCDWCDSTECCVSAQRLQSVVWTVKG